MAKHTLDPQMEMQSLQAAHRDLKQRVAYLERRAHLTPREQLEAADLKKRKLATKDAIAQLSADLN